MQKRNINFEDCPQLDFRDYAPTKHIRDEPTVLNYKKVTIKVPSNEVKKGGFFSSDYTLFDVESDMPSLPKQKVKRKDIEFYTLRRLLKNQF